MDKININLSPKKTDTENVALKKLLYYVNLGIFFSLIIIVVLGVLIVARLGVSKYYGIRWSKWADKYASLSKIKKEITALENEKNELKKVVTPKVQMAKVFEDIFAALPQNLWFNNFNYKQNSLSLRGYVVKIDEDYLVSLEKLINNLEKKEYFSSQFGKINIKDSQKKDYNGIEVLEFSLECVK